jgi:hypothetical protein
MSENEIKYRAYAKGWAKIISLQCDVERVNRDVERELTGGVTLDEVKAVRDGLQAEYEVWNYIFKLIEKDNK